MLVCGLDGKMTMLQLWIMNMQISQDKYTLMIKTACFGIAGPVINGECRTSNLPWVVSEEKLRRHFGWQQVRLLNDLVTNAMAGSLLRHREIKTLNTAKIRKDQNIGLVVPGTGLGLALLVYADGRYRPVASEGGHASYAPCDESEIDLWRYLHVRFGHASMERVLSGQGLVNIYDWPKSGGNFVESPRIQAAMRTLDAAQVISANAINDTDPLCRARIDAGRL